MGRIVSESGGRMKFFHHEVHEGHEGFRDADTCTEHKCGVDADFFGG